MNSVRGLLLLPLPPQNTAYPLIRIALYPSISAAINLIQKSGRKVEACVLEIAVPVTRIRETVGNHGDLFKQTNSLVANIYRLVSTICKELGTLLGNLDARVLLVQDQLDLNDEDTSPLGVLDYSALATSDRRWTHVFAVESEQGEDVLRKFRAMVRQHGLLHEALFAGVRRVASGMQIYIPTSSTFIPSKTEAESDITMITIPEDASMTRVSNHMVVIISGNIEDQYCDKHLLTMALLRMERPTERQAAGIHLNGIQKPNQISVVVSKRLLEEGLKRRVRDFIFETVSEKLAQQYVDDNMQLSFSRYEDIRTTCATSIPSMLIVSSEYENLAEDWVAKGNSSILLGSVGPVDEADN